MTKYILKRLLYLIPSVIGVVFIVYTIMSLTPGDPGRLLLGINAEQSAVDMLNHQLGFDKPYLARFADYIIRFAQGDLGISYRTQSQFAKELLARVPITLRLGVLAMAFSSVIGVTIGIVAAIRQYSLTDTLSTVIALLFASVPTFFVGLMLIYLFALRLHVLPTNGINQVSGYIMPVITLTVASVAVIIRFSRTAMLDAVRQDYIRTARAKGCPEKRVIVRHALKNALIPIITLLGVNFGTVLGGSVIIENVFNIPGIGTYILTAIRSKDMPIVMSSTIVLATYFCIIMIAVDILYAFIDPRIRARYSR
ncbi:peptide ABC transporter permease [Clostridia bacterium]|nr:peptide ABC transporter permease [Clostridia bacterium]